GVPVPVFHKGEQVGERRWYNDRLLMFTLRHHDPERFGAMSAGGFRQVPPHVKKALKQGWEAGRHAALQLARARQPDPRARLLAKRAQRRERMTGPPGPHSSPAEIMAWSLGSEEIEDAIMPPATDPRDDSDPWYPDEE